MTAAIASTPLPATSGIMIGMKAKDVPCTMGIFAPTGPEGDGLQTAWPTPAKNIAIWIM